MNRKIKRKCKSAHSLATDFDWNFKYQYRNELRTHLKETAFGWKDSDMTIITSSTSTTHVWNTLIPPSSSFSSLGLCESLCSSMEDLCTEHAITKEAFFPRKSQNCDWLWNTVSFPRRRPIIFYFEQTRPSGLKTSFETQCLNSKFFLYKFGLHTDSNIKNH